MIHFSNDEALADLSRLMAEYDRTHAFDIHQTVGDQLLPGPNDVDQFWAALRRRPGMFIGSVRGRALHDFLIGLDRGGDWLGLPELPGLRQVVETIESRSTAVYGSRFAAYRVYDHNGAQTLLGWAFDDT